MVWGQPGAYLVRHHASPARHHTSLTSHTPLAHPIPGKSRTPLTPPWQVSHTTHSSPTSHTPLVHPIPRKSHTPLTHPQQITHRSLIQSLTSLADHSLLPDKSHTPPAHPRWATHTAHPSTLSPPKGQWWVMMFNNNLSRFTSSKSTLTWDPSIKASPPSRCSLSYQCIPQWSRLCVPSAARGAKASVDWHNIKILPIGIILDYVSPSPSYKGYTTLAWTVRATPSWLPYPHFPKAAAVIDTEHFSWWTPHRNRQLQRLTTIGLLSHCGQVSNLQNFYLRRPNFLRKRSTNFSNCGLQRSFLMVTLRPSPITNTFTAKLTQSNLVTSSGKMPPSSMKTRSRQWLVLQSGWLQDMMFGIETLAKWSRIS